MLVNNAYDLVGSTPIIELKHLKEELGLLGNVYAKVEYFNPAGSIKDRIALKMIVDAENKGLLKRGSTIIEPTSGNTGIGLASISAMKGYRCIIVMPESMSIERRKIIKAYGAELVLSEGALGMKGAIAKANELHNTIKDSIILGQFDNPSNVAAHYENTGPEIYKDMNAKVDVFVAGVGTGGTITGVGKYLKEQNKDIEVVAVEPESSPVLSKGVSGKHMIQGIGAGFVPSILNTSIYNQIITVSNEDAFKYARMMGKKEGILVGISSGAALCAAFSLAKQEKYKNKNIVVILPDTGDRYLSTPLIED